MIGKVYLSVVDFYDVKLNATNRKVRPVLIIGGPNENDYTVLPISTITNRANVNAYYDILVSPQDRTILNLKRECFIRTHKQMQIHVAALIRELADMKKDLPDLYLETIGKMDEFQHEIVKYSI